MKVLFQKIPVKIPNQSSPKEKRKSLLYAIGGGWYVDKLGKKLTPLQKSKLRKEEEEEENEIKRKITVTNQESCDWKFQIHWNKLERVNPRSRDERKIHFVFLQKQFVFKIIINPHIC